MPDIPEHLTTAEIAALSDEEADRYFFRFAVSDLHYEGDPREDARRSFDPDADDDFDESLVMTEIEKATWAISDEAIYNDAVDNTAHQLVREAVEADADPAVSQLMLTVCAKTSAWEKAPKAEAIAAVILYALSKARGEGDLPEPRQCAKTATVRYSTFLKLLRIADQQIQTLSLKKNGNL